MAPASSGPPHCSNEPAPWPRMSGRRTRGLSKQHGVPRVPGCPSEVRPPGSKRNSAWRKGSGRCDEQRRHGSGTVQRRDERRLLTYSTVARPLWDAAGGGEGVDGYGYIAGPILPTVNMRLDNPVTGPSAQSSLMAAGDGERPEARDAPPGQAPPRTATARQPMSHRRTAQRAARQQALRGLPRSLADVQGRSISFNLTRPRGMR
jgi:hypothetical protein